MCFICLTSSWPIYLNPYLNITPYWTKPITHLSLPPAPIMAAQFLKESGGGTVQVETRECREKNDQAKAKHAEQWANLASQVGPLLLGNMNTVVLFLKKQKKTYFSLIWWGPFLDIYYYFYYHLYIFFHFLPLYIVCCCRFTICALPWYKPFCYCLCSVRANLHKMAAFHSSHSVPQSTITLLDVSFKNRRLYRCVERKINDSKMLSLLGHSFIYFFLIYFFFLPSFTFSLFPSSPCVRWLECILKTGSAWFPSSGVRRVCRVLGRWVCCVGPGFSAG